MIVNSCFPEDSKSLIIHMDPELEEVIVVIKNLVTNYHFDDVIWMGEINSDFNRNTKYICRFTVYPNIKVTWFFP